MALFTVLWWAWASYTFFADRYDTDDVGQRLLSVAQMVAVVGMAASFGLGDERLGTISRQFGASYALARLVLVLMYVRAWRSVPQTQPLVGGYLKGFSVEVVLWAASVLTPPPWRYALWAAGLGISFATPWLMRAHQVRVPLSVSHLPERFGLFTILVLGESIAAVAVGAGDEVWAVGSTVVGIAGVVVATSLWWVYFDNLEGSVVRRDPNKQHDWRPTAWIYSHLPLAVGLTMAGLGLEGMIAHASGHLDAGHRWLAAGGVGVAQLAMAMILVSSTPWAAGLQLGRRALARVVGAGAVGLLAIGGGGFSPTAFGLGLALICAAQVVVDVVDHWFWAARASETLAPDLDEGRSAG